MSENNVKDFEIDENGVLTGYTGSDTEVVVPEGVVELEFPRDKNDFMAAREFIFLHNVRYIHQPEQKDPRVWL